MNTPSASTPNGYSSLKVAIVQWLARHQPLVLEALRLLAWLLWRISRKPMLSLFTTGAVISLIVAGSQSALGWPWFAAAGALVVMAFAAAVAAFAQARAARADERRREELATLRDELAQLETRLAEKMRALQDEQTARQRMALSLLDRRLARLEQAITPEAAASESKLFDTLGSRLSTIQAELSTASAEQRALVARTTALEQSAAFVAHEQERRSEETAALHQGLRASAEEVRVLSDAMAELNAKVESTRQSCAADLAAARAELSATASGHSANIIALSSALTELSVARQEAREAIAATTATNHQQLAEAQKEVESVRSDLGRTRSALARMNGANAANARVMDRLLASDKLQRLEQHWLKVFGLQMGRSALAYLAHRICVAEDRCEGRIAAPIETAMMRVLALRSLPPGPLQVMEIGTLFGIGAGILHTLAGPQAESVSLTLIDPLAGYYDSGALDPTSGVPVTRKVLERNLQALNIPDADWRLIERRSTDPRSIVEAMDRTYDFIVIDGDHSVDGVARDYELYGDMVAPGGLLLFDDYDNPDWPGIRPYVDEYVRSNPKWQWIGGEYRTGIVRRRPDEKSARDDAGSVAAKRRLSTH